MYKLLCKLIHQRKLEISLLILLCIGHSATVIFLNKGYAILVDNILTGTQGLLLSSTILLFTTGIVQVSIVIFQNYISSMLSEKMGYELRKEAFAGVLTADYKKIEDLSIGESLTKLNTDLASITSWIKNEFTALIYDCILFVIVLAWMVYSNWKLTVISFCIVPFFSVGSYLLSKSITYAEIEKNKVVADVNILAKSIIDAFPILKLFQMKNSMLLKVDEKIGLSIAAEIKANSIRAKLMSVNGFVSYIPTTLMWCFGGYMVITGGLSAGSLLAFTNMSNFIRAPLVNLPARIDALRTSSANTTRVFNLLHHLREPKLNAGGM